MTAKSSDDKALARIDAGTKPEESLQSTEPLQVTLSGRGDSRGFGEDSPVVEVPNSRPFNDEGASGRECVDSISCNTRFCKHLDKVQSCESSENAGRKRESAIATSTFVRWLRFNFVGGIGILVQFFALFLLKSVLQLDYLVATALAVEAAVVHNFIWHERYTWADRVPSWHRAHAASEAETRNLWVKLLAVLKRVWANVCRPLRDSRHSPVFTRHWRVGLSHVAPSGLQDWTGNRSGRLLTEALKCRATPRKFGPSLTRFLRFNVTNGGVSIAGNLALMKVMVGTGHMNYLLANGIAIALCSLANFLVSETWVFRVDE